MFGVWRSRRARSKKENFLFPLGNNALRNIDGRARRDSGKIIWGLGHGRRFGGSVLHRSFRNYCRDSILAGPIVEYCPLPIASGEGSRLKPTETGRVRRPCLDDGEAATHLREAGICFIDQDAEVGLRAAGTMSV